MTKTYNETLENFINGIKSVLETDEDDLIFVPPTIMSSSDNSFACIATINLISDDDSEDEEQSAPPLPLPIDLTDDHFMNLFDCQFPDIKYPIPIEDNILKNCNSINVEPLKKNKCKQFGKSK